MEKHLPFWQSTSKSVCVCVCVVELCVIRWNHLRLRKGILLFWWDLITAKCQQGNMCSYVSTVMWPKKWRKSSRNKKLLHNTDLVSNRIRFILIELSWARICEDGQRALHLPVSSLLNNGEDWNPKRLPGPFIMNPQDFSFWSFLTRSVVRRRMCRGRLEWCCWTAKNWSWAAISRQSVKTFLIWWLHTSGSWNTIFSV